MPLSRRKTTFGLILLLGGLALVTACLLNRGPLALLGPGFLFAGLGALYLFHDRHTSLVGDTADNITLLCLGSGLLLILLSSSFFCTAAPIFCYCIFFLLAIIAWFLATTPTERFLTDEGVDVARTVLVTISFLLFMGLVTSYEEVRDDFGDRYVAGYTTTAADEFVDPKFVPPHALFNTGGDAIYADNELALQLLLWGQPVLVVLGIATVVLTWLGATRAVKKRDRQRFDPSAILGEDIIAGPWLFYQAGDLVERWLESKGLVGLVAADPKDLRKVIAEYLRDQSPGASEGELPEGADRSAERAICYADQYIARTSEGRRYRAVRIRMASEIDEWIGRILFIIPESWPDVNEKRKEEID